MKRRTFLKGSALGSVAILLGSGIAWISVEEASQPLTIKATLETLEKLNISQVNTTGEWNLVQILTHCAQSVEYSMTGFPMHKPEWFKRSIGKAAFAAFKAKGKMHHPLNEVIPGAPTLISGQNLQQAVLRFKTALQTFQTFNQALQAHFAYGPLSKAEYEIAHVIHFNNHLQEINITG